MTLVTLPASVEPYDSLYDISEHERPQSAFANRAYLDSAEDNDSRSEDDTDAAGDQCSSIAVKQLSSTATE